MPTENICNTCPNKEYKTLKKKNRQKRADLIASETKIPLTAQLASSLMPASLYTCKSAPDYSKNPDYIKCYACNTLNGNANLSDCQLQPNNSSKLVNSWCNIKTHQCFSKAVYNSTTNELIEFSRGCGLNKDVGLNVTVEARDACTQHSNATDSCILLCNSHLCNSESELKPVIVPTSSSTLTTANYMFLIGCLFLFQHKFIF